MPERRRKTFRAFFVAAVFAAAAFSAAASPAQGQTAKVGSLRVEIRTGGAVSRDEIAEALQRQKNLRSGADIAAFVRSWLGKQGFWRARVTAAADSAGGVLRLEVREGPKIHLRALRFHFPADFADRAGTLRRTRRLRGGDSVETAIEEMLARLEQQGYPFARARLDSILPAERRGGRQEFVLVYRVIPGRQTRIDSIRIEGNHLTRRQVILRELGLRAGMLYDGAAVRRIPERLMRLGWFEQVEPPQLLQNGAGHSILLLRVKEGRTNNFNGVLGYNPGQAGRSGYFTGLVDVQFANLLGTGRRIAVRWEKRGPETQELALAFREPWVAGLPLHLEGGFEQLIQDTSYVRRDWRLGAQWPFFEGMQLVARLEQSSVLPDSVGLALGIPPSRSRAAGIGLSYQSLDDPINPRRGATFSTLLETISKNVEASGAAGSRFRQRRIIVDATWNLPLREFQVFHVGVHGRQITSNETQIALSDQFRFGGAATLRGYREDQFRGSRVAWANVEYRYLLSRRSRMEIFYDIGFFSRRERDGSLLRRVKQSWGFGLRLETRLGIVGIDYGLGEGDGVLEGKIHIRMVNAF